MINIKFNIAECQSETQLGNFPLGSTITTPKDIDVSIIGKSVEKSCWL